MIRKALKRLCAVFVRFWRRTQRVVHRWKPVVCDLFKIILGNSISGAVSGAVGALVLYWLQNRHF